MQQGPSRIPSEQPDAGTSPLGLPKTLREGNLRKSRRERQQQRGPGRADAPGRAPPVWQTPRPSRRPPSGHRGGSEAARHGPAAKKLFDGRPALRYFYSSGAGRGEGFPKGHACSPSKGKEHKRSLPGSPPDGAGQVTRRSWGGAGTGDRDKGQGEGPRRREAAPLALAASRRRLPEDAARSPSSPRSFDFSPQLRAHRGTALGTVVSRGAGRPVPTADTRLGTAGGTGRAAAKPKGQQNHKCRGQVRGPSTAFWSRAF